MKTVKQIANEIGVSKQAIHQKIKQEPLMSNLRQLMTKKGNTLYIDVDGENIIKQSFEKEPTMADANKTAIVGNKTSDAINQMSITETLVDMLKLDIEFKNRQLEAKDVQIAELQYTVNTQQETIKDLVTNLNAAQALHAGTIQAQLEAGATAEQEPDAPVDDTLHPARRWWRFWK